MHLQLEDIHKTYGRVKANVGISLSLAPGRIYGLLGENGAGKSTLMRVLAGHTRPDKGRVLKDGQDLGVLSPKRALAEGVGMLYQDPLDFPALKVWENFQLGAPYRSRSAASARLDELGRPLQFQLPPDKTVGELTVGERQQLEILRLLDAGVKTLILDEPTTGLSLPQKKLLFATLKTLAQEPDRVLIVVTHKLADAQELCHEVFVLRQGRLAGRLEAPLDPNEILGLMFGEEASAENPAPDCAAPEGKEPLVVLSQAEFLGDQYSIEADIRLRPGEIVGLAGLEGSGQELFLKGLAGLARLTRGRMALEGQSLTGRPYLAFRRAGIHFLPAARMEQGLFPDLCLSDHIRLAFPDKKKRLARFYQEECVDRYRLMADPGTLARMLSGGNQQRLLLSLIPQKTKLLLMEHPTRGLDLGSARQVWRHLEDRCRNGAALIFSSADLDEILAHGHRVLVFFNRRVIADLCAAEARADRIGSLMAGRDLDEEGAR